jgi:hypothetical protein
MTSVVFPRHHLNYMKRHKSQQETQVATSPKLPKLPQATNAYPHPKLSPSQLHLAPVQCLSTYKRTHITCPRVPGSYALPQAP